MKGFSFINTVNFSDYNRGVSVGFLRLALIVIIFFCTGCTTIKIPQAVGGSKSDATVKLTYEYGFFEKPEVDWDKAKLKAKVKCNAWGYSNAEPFEASQDSCIAWNGYGNCIRRAVTTTYQCTN